MWMNLVMGFILVFTSAHYCCNECHKSFSLVFFILVLKSISNVNCRFSWDTYFTQHTKIYIYIYIYICKKIVIISFELHVKHSLCSSAANQYLQYNEDQVSRALCRQCIWNVRHSLSTWKMNTKVSLPCPHKSLLLVSVLCEMNPVYGFPSYIGKIISASHLHQFIICRLQREQSMTEVNQHHKSNKLLKIYTWKQIWSKVFQCTLCTWNFIHRLWAISVYKVHRINLMAIFLLFLSYDLYLTWLSSSITFLPR